MQCQMQGITKEEDDLEP